MRISFGRESVSRLVIVATEGGKKSGKQSHGTSEKVSLHAGPLGFDQRIGRVLHLQAIKRGSEEVHLPGKIARKEMKDFDLIQQDSRVE